MEGGPVSIVGVGGMSSSKRAAFFFACVTSVFFVNGDNVKFDFNDIVIVPARESRIRSRKEIDVFDENRRLPLIVAPVDTVIDEKNYVYRRFDTVGAAGAGVPFRSRRYPLRAYFRWRRSLPGYGVLYFTGP